MSSSGERYSKVSRRIWNDARFRSLSHPQPNGQTLWQRLLTGPELTNIPGCFQAWEGGLAQALQWDLEAFREAFREVSREGMAEADWNTGFIWVPKAINHNRPESPNVVKAWAATWDQLPECPLKAKAYHSLKAFVEGMGKGFAEAFAQACRKPSPKPSPKACPNQEQEQEQEQDPPFAPRGGGGAGPDQSGPDEPRAEPEDGSDDQPPAAEPEPLEAPESAKSTDEDARKVFEFWAKEHGHEAAKFDPKRKARIKARLRDGFSGRDLCIAIRGAKKDAHLMGQNDRNRVFDGIETLLRDAAMVERLMLLGGQARGEAKSGPISSPLKLWKPEPLKPADPNPPPPLPPLPPKSPALMAREAALAADSERFGTKTDRDSLPMVKRASEPPKAIGEPFEETAGNITGSVAGG